MKFKRNFAACILFAFVFLLAGCGDNEGNSSYFENYSAEVSEDGCSVKGTVHTADGSVDIVYIDCLSDTDVSMEYRFTRSEGNIKIYYQSPDGTNTLLEDTSKQNGEIIDGACGFSLKKGQGKLYISSEDDMFDFMIRIHVPEELIQYFDSISPEESDAIEQRYEEYEKRL